MKIPYDKIRKLRELILEETKNQFGAVLNVDHHILVEHRLQSALLAGLDDVDVSKEKGNFNKK